MTDSTDVTAFQAFRQWTQCVHQQMPGTAIYEEDNQKIILDFAQVLQDALRAVKDKYPDPKGLIEYYTALGYLEGFVMGKLAAHWSYQYLPLPARLDYQIWFLAFRQYAKISEKPGSV